MRAPVINNVVDVKHPVLGRIVSTDDYKWAFSFEYFNQIKYFGLGEAEPKWFLSLIERMQTLSKIKIEDFDKNHQLKNAYRYHKINWNGQAVPYQRTDFNWIKKEVIENDEEFPFFQFQISTGLGRVIGFWDLTKTFQIVLLDRMHNMQPSKDFNYSVDDTTQLSCEMTSLLIDIENIRKLNCEDENCAVKNQLNQVPSKLNRGNFVYFLLEDDYFEQLNEQLTKSTLREIIEMGIVVLS
ncbi:hypothetical protein [Flavobacterium sp.]|uniref:hypothetical protein n=1 Tax=Flavobacterium sp. TaxID=239 RepID=UPI0040343699